MKKFIRCPYCRHKLFKCLEAINSIGEEIYCWKCKNCNAYFTEKSPMIMPKINFLYVGEEPKMEVCDIEELK